MLSLVPTLTLLPPTTILNAHAIATLMSLPTVQVLPKPLRLMLILALLTTTQIFRTLGRVRTCTGPAALARSPMRPPATKLQSSPGTMRSPKANTTTKLVHQTTAVSSVTLPRSSGRLPPRSAAATPTRAATSSLALIIRPLFADTPQPATMSVNTLTMLRPFVAALRTSLPL